MINSQWKALHLGRWELLFKIMDEGSITRVADIENLQRSQLSRMVSGLEEELGVQLLERRGKRLNPTQVALELRSKIEPHNSKKATREAFVSVQCPDSSRLRLFH